MLTSMKLALLGLLSPLANAARPAFHPKDDLVVTISTDKTDFGLDDKVLVTFTMKNNLDKGKPARLLDWMNPCQDVSEDDSPTEMSFFDVSGSRGNKAAYVGAVFKRQTPKDKNYKMLKPGEEVSCIINVGAFYDLSSSSDGGRNLYGGKSMNEYKIAYSVKGMQLSNPQGNSKKAIETLDSNTIVVKVAPREAATPSGNRRVQSLRNDMGIRNLQLQQTTFTGCTTNQKNLLTEARQEAYGAAVEASNHLSFVGNDDTSCPRYIEWFGSYNSARILDVKTNFETIRDKLVSTQALTFDCTCNDSYFAYVYPNSPYEIYFCNAFWNANMLGTDSKMGTVIHEMSHFTIVADTDDNVYGQNGCRNLADTDPTSAINNADSHEYFAENFPDLNNHVVNSCSVADCFTCTSTSTQVCAVCDGGFYLNSDSCAVCSVLANCDACSSSTTCTACADGFYLDVDSCAACSAVANCDKCSSATTCTACSAGYVLGASGDCILPTTDVISLSTSEIQRYQISMSAGATASCSTTGDNGDADLYLRLDAAAETSNYDCRSWSSSSNENCGVLAGSDATLHVSVYAYGGFSNILLTCTVEGGTTTTAEPTTAGPTSGPTAGPTSGPTAAAEPTSATPTSGPTAGPTAGPTTGPEITTTTSTTTTSTTCTPPQTIPPGGDCSLCCTTRNNGCNRNGRCKRL